MVIRSIARRRSVLVALLGTFFSAPACPPARAQAPKAKVARPAPTLADVPYGGAVTAAGPGCRVDPHPVGGPI